MLLSIMESGGSWSSEQQGVVGAFSTLLWSKRNPGRDYRLPSIRSVLRGFKDVEMGLSNLPHVRKDRVTGGVVEELQHPLLNALNVLAFWRWFRNNCVHKGRVVSLAHLKTWGPTWDMIRGPYPHVAPLEVGTRLLLYDDMVRAAMSVHYRSAEWMNDRLRDVAGDRRGHPLAPMPRVEDQVFPDPPPKSQPLLLEGDHSPSWQAWRSLRALSRMDRDADSGA